MSAEIEGGRPLDPQTDPDRWERIVRSIMLKAGAELDRLAASRSPLSLITGWSRPVLAAAAIVLVAASTAILAYRQQATPDSSAAAGATVDTPVVAEAIAPRPVAVWLLGGAYPTSEQFVNAIQETR